MYVRQMLENSFKDDKTHSFCSLKCITWQLSDKYSFFESWRFLFQIMAQMSSTLIFHRIPQYFQASAQMISQI